MKTVSKVHLRVDAMLSLGQTTMVQFASSTGKLSFLNFWEKVTRVILSQAQGHSRVDLSTNLVLRFHLLLHLLWQARLQALYRMIKNSWKESIISTGAKLSWRLAFTKRWKSLKRLAEGSRVQIYFFKYWCWVSNSFNEIQNSSVKWMQEQYQ